MNMCLLVERKARFLLRALLGQVNVRLPHQSDRYKYKDEYVGRKL